MPRWSSTKNQFVRGDSITPVTSAAKTANGDTGWLSSEDFHQAELTLAVTAVGGDADETLDVTVSTASSSAGANSRTVASFAQKTQPGGATTERKLFGGLDDFYKVAWVVGGTTPSFTISVSGVTK